MEPPTALGPRSIGEEKNKVFRSLSPIEPSHVVPANTTATSTSPACARTRYRDVHRAPPARSTTGVGRECPSTCGPGSGCAGGSAFISIAFREPPKSMFPAGSGVGAHGPDHLPRPRGRVEALAVVLWEASRSGHDPRQAESPSSRCTRRGVPPISRGVRASDLRRDDGDHTLFTSAEGIEKLWEHRSRSSRTRARPALPAGIVGPTRSTSYRSRCLAAAVRARVRSRGGDRVSDHNGLSWGDEWSSTASRSCGTSSRPSLMNDHVGVGRCGRCSLEHDALR